MLHVLDRESLQTLDFLHDGRFFERALAEFVHVFLGSLGHISHPVWNMAQVSSTILADGNVWQLGSHRSPGLHDHVILPLFLINADVKGKNFLGQFGVTCHLWNRLGRVLFDYNHLLDESGHNRGLVVFIKDEDTHHTVVQNSVHDTGVDGVVCTRGAGTGTGHKRRVCDACPRCDLDISQVVEWRGPVDANISCPVVELLGWNMLGVRWQRDPGRDKAVTLLGGRLGLEDNLYEATAMLGPNVVGGCAEDTELLPQLGRLPRRQGLGPKRQADLQVRLIVFHDQRL